jgi:hypothetical protein
LNASNGWEWVRIRRWESKQNRNEREKLRWEMVVLVLVEPSVNFSFSLIFFFSWHVRTQLNQPYMSNSLNLPPPTITFSSPKHAFSNYTFKSLHPFDFHLHVSSQVHFSSIFSLLITFSFWSMALDSDTDTLNISTLHIPNYISVVGVSGPVWCWIPTSSTDTPRARRVWVLDTYQLH